MKKAKRIIGMVLLIVGGFGFLTGLISLWAVLTTRDVDYRLASAVMVLIYVLFNAGIFTLGWRLRHPRGKARDPEQERPAPAKPVYDPPRPRKLTAEEKQRQAEEKAERERLWREQAEAMKKARREALAPWKDIDPEEAEHIARWESALALDCAIECCYLSTLVDDQGLDGLYDHTGADWFILGKDSDLAKVVRLYAEVDSYRKACEVHGVNPKHTENGTLYRLMQFYYELRFLIVTKESFLKMGEDTAQCLALCREHKLHLVHSQSGENYLDLDSGRLWNVYIAGEFPGSADDAATYGSLGLDWTDPEPGPKAPRRVDPARGQYTLDYLLALDVPFREQGPGAQALRFEKGQRQWRLTVQLDQERLWFLSVFVTEDGKLKKYALDYEGAADSHYEFTNEKAIREKLCAPGDEALYFHEILIRTVKEWGGNALLTQIMPFVTAQFHYD